MSTTAGPQELQRQKGSSCQSFRGSTAHALDLRLLASRTESVAMMVQHPAVDLCGSSLSRLQGRGHDETRNHFESLLCPYSLHGPHTHLRLWQ